MSTLIVKAYNDDALKNFAGQPYDAVASIDMTSQTINMYIADGLGSFTDSGKLEADDYHVHENELGELVLSWDNTDYLIIAADAVIELESYYTNPDLTQYGIDVVAPELDVDVATDNQILIKLLDVVFAKVPTFAESGKNPSKYLANDFIIAKEEAKPFLGLGGTITDYHDLTAKHRELSANHLNKGNLAVGLIAEVIVWSGNVTYGLTLPDNLHPCDGSVITNPLSPLAGENAYDYRGRCLVGTGALAATYVNSNGTPVSATQNWFVGTKRGSVYKNLASYNIPRMNITVPARSGTISGTAANKRSVGTGYKMWCFPDSVPDYWNTGSDLPGSGNKYPFTNGPEYFTTGTHSHTVSGSCSISASYTSVGQQYATAFEMLQPSVGVNMYMIIY